MSGTVTKPTTIATSPFSDQATGPAQRRTWKDQATGPARRRTWKDQATGPTGRGHSKIRRRAREDPQSRT